MPPTARGTAYSPIMSLTTTPSYMQKSPLSLKRSTNSLVILLTISWGCIARHPGETKHTSKPQEGKTPSKQRLNLEMRYPVKITIHWHYRQVSKIIHTYYHYSYSYTPGCLACSNSPHHCQQEYLSWQHTWSKWRRQIIWQARRRQRQFEEPDLVYHQCPKITTTSLTQKLSGNKPLSKPESEAHSSMGKPDPPSRSIRRL